MVIYFFCYMGYPVVLAPFVEMTLFSSLDCFWSLRGKSVCHIRISFWLVNSVPLIDVSIILPMPYSFGYCSFIIIFEIEKFKPQTLFFFFKIFLAILGSLHSYFSFTINLSFSTKILIVSNL